MLKKFVTKLDDFLPATLIVILLTVVVFVAFLWLADQPTTDTTFSFLIILSPIWVPAALAYFFFKLWMKYVQTKTFLEIENTLLEIRLPREVTQTPLAMENALNAFFVTGEPENLREAYFAGKTRVQSSLEIVSFEGDVHFYVRTRAGHRNIIESQLYSQYPTIEIEEVPDYMDRFHFDPEKNNLFGVEQKLQKEDPYPIKTYVDFGLDKQEKEEFKVDPITGILEFFGSFTKGEYGLFQIIIRSHQSDKKKPGTWFGKQDWVEEGEQLINKILEGTREMGTGPLGEFSFRRAPTTPEKDLIDAISRNTGKKPFDTGIRSIYFADKEHYNKDRHGGLPTMMRQFESHAFNGFKPVFWTRFGKKLEDVTGKRLLGRKKEILDAYRCRSYLMPPHERPYKFVLSAEELATVYHFPGGVAQTPTVGRIPSRRAEAPPNLPV